MFLGEYLEEYLQKKKISLKQASTMIGIDRTQLKRYIKNDRHPSEIATVDKIAIGLGVSIEEYDEMINLYKRDDMGENQYQINFFLDSYLRGDEETKENTSEYKYEEISLDNFDSVYIKSEEQFKKIATNILKTAKDVKIFSDANDKNMDCLMSINDGCNITHLMEFNASGNDENALEIEIFKKQLSFLNKGKSYYTLFKFSKNNVFISKYFILSENAVIVFSKSPDDEILAVLSNDKVIHKYYERKFEQLLDISYPYAVGRNITSKDTTVYNSSNINLIIENKHQEFDNKKCCLFYEGKREKIFLERDLVELLEKYIKDRES